MRNILFLVLFLVPGPILAATYTINSYFTDTVLFTDFLANATNYFDAKISQSQYFPNTVTLNVTGKKAVAPPPPPPPSGTVTTQDLLNTIVRISTETYVYGFADGQSYERHVDLGLIGNWMVQCSTTTVDYSLVNYDAENCGTVVNIASTSLAGFIGKCSTDQTVFGLPAGSMSISNCEAVATTMQTSVSNIAVTCPQLPLRKAESENCLAPLGSVYFGIYDQNFSSPTVIPPAGFP